MSKLKKLMAITLALVMALALMVPAMADGETYSITIKNSDNDTVSIIGKTYSAYKVFDLTLGGATPTYTRATEFKPSTTYYTELAGEYKVAANVTAETFADGEYFIKGNDKYSAYAYSIKNTDWAWEKLIAGATTATNGEITTTYGIILRPSATDSKVYIVDVSMMTDSNARHLADALKGVLPPIEDADGTVANAATEDVTISLTKPGYYAVYGTAKPKSDESQEVVAAVALTTTNPTAVVVPKVEVPTLEKRILAETVLDNKSETASIGPGSEVTFELTSTIPDLRGYLDYTFKISDTMSSGLSFKGPDTANAITGLKVEIQRGSKMVSLANTEFIIAHTVGEKRFELTIPYNTLKAFTKDAPIHVTYSAIVNGDSLDTNYEKNSATLTYSNNPYDSTTNITPNESVYIVNVNVDVEKVASNNSGTKLAGAEFKLYRKSSLPEDIEHEWYKWDSVNNTVTYTTKDQADTFTTDVNGKLTTQIRGLAVTQNGVAYGLVETKAPVGYNLLSEPVAFSLKGTYNANNKRITIQYKPSNGEWENITSNATIDVNSDATANLPTQTIQVTNGTSTMLPATGGAGLYIVAGVAIVALLGFGGTAMLKRKVNGGE